MTRFLLAFLFLLVNPSWFFSLQNNPLKLYVLSPASLAIDDSALAAERKAGNRVDFFGDVMLDRQVASAMGSKGLSYVFALVVSTTLINKNFYNVANLEGPFSATRLPASKSIAFSFNPKLAPELKSAGFDAFNLANNHAYDMGSANVAYTRATLSKAGLAYFGDELNEKPATLLVVTSTPKLASPVAFVGLHVTYRLPNYKDLAATMALATSSAKIVLVDVHWGVEYARLSNARQQELAHWLVDHGASAVIGGHPHVIQEAEIYKGVPIFYSLGNFIFDQYFSPDTQRGLKVSLLLNNDRVTSLQVTPFYSKKSQVYLMSAQDQKNIFDWLNKNSRLNGKKFFDGILSL